MVKTKWFSVLTKLLRRVFKLHWCKHLCEPRQSIRAEGRSSPGKTSEAPNRCTNQSLRDLRVCVYVCVCVCVCVCSRARACMYILKISLGELQEATRGSSLDCYLRCCNRVHTVGEGRGSQGNTQFWKARDSSYHLLQPGNKVFDLWANF